MGAFVISKRYNDEYKFVFTSRKGKVVFTSLSYELKFECEEDIERFKTNMQSANFLKFKSSSGKFYFKLCLEIAILQQVESILLPCVCRRELTKS